MEANSRKHIIVVHGACHGAWCWFKVATRLRSAGHRVTTPDLAASGVDPRPLREVPTFRDYTKPLLDILDALPPGEKVVLVGHSLGGMNIALASELFPEKVAAVVFLTAFMPDHTFRPSHVLEKGNPADMMDSETKSQDPEGKLPTSFLIGPQFTRQKVYRLCSSEMSTDPNHYGVFPQSFYGQHVVSFQTSAITNGSGAMPVCLDTSSGMNGNLEVLNTTPSTVVSTGSPNMISDSNQSFKYGGPMVVEWSTLSYRCLTMALTRLHTWCFSDEDRFIVSGRPAAAAAIFRGPLRLGSQGVHSLQGGPSIVEEHQRWMIENNPVQEVKELDGADHMAMLSRSDELTQCLADIAEKYA